MVDKKGGVERRTKGFVENTEMQIQVVGCSGYRIARYRMPDRIRWILNIECRILNISFEYKIQQNLQGNLLISLIDE